MNDPAFPTTAQFNSFGELINSPSQGMTLRDYFAAQASTVLLTELINEVKSTSYETGEIYRFSASRSYDFADAMLKAREQ